MFRLAVSLSLLFPIEALTAAHEPGDQLVVTRSTEMKAVTGSTFTLTPGTSLTVRAGESGQLKVAAPHVGWIDASAVIPAKEAEAFFSQQIDKGTDKATALLARG